MTPNSAAAGHQRGVGDHAERARPNHDPREQEADDGDQADSVANVGDRCRRNDQRDGLNQERRCDGSGKQHDRRAELQFRQPYNDAKYR